MKEKASEIDHQLFWNLFFHYKTLLLKYSLQLFRGQE